MPLIELPGEVRSITYECKECTAGCTFTFRSSMMSLEKRYGNALRALNGTCGIAAFAETGNCTAPDHSHTCPMCEKEIDEFDGYAHTWSYEQGSPTQVVETWVCICPHCAHEHKAVAKYGLTEIAGTVDGGDGHE